MIYMHIRNNYIMMKNEIFVASCSIKSLIIHVDNMTRQEFL